MTQGRGESHTQIPLWSLRTQSYAKYLLVMFPINLYFSQPNTEIFLLSLELFPLLYLLSDPTSHMCSKWTFSKPSSPLCSVKPEGENISLVGSHFVPSSCYLMFQFSHCLMITQSKVAGLASDYICFSLPSPAGTDWAYKMERIYGRRLWPHYFY